MHIALVQPFDPHRRYYALIPNVGLAYLAGVAERAGHQVTFIDCLKESLPPEKLDQRLRDAKPDIVGITFFSPDYAIVKRYVTDIDRHTPRPIIITGGPHPSFEPESTLREFPAIDVAFRGEAEQSLDIFLGKVSAGSSPARAASETFGTAYRDGGAIALTDPAPYIDVNEHPIPAWHIVKPETYPTAPNGIFSKHPRLTSLIATRGCRYKCTFCGVAKMLGHNVRSRNPENLVEEIRQLVARGIREIHFMDDSFTQNRAFVLEFCRLLTESRLNVPWACTNGIRLDTLDPEVVTAMERSGCYSFAVGIESGSPRVLSIINKGITVENVVKQVNMIHSCSRIRMTGLFIIGYPGETVEDIKSTVKLSQSLPIDRANFFNFLPFPGSVMYERFKAEGKMDGIDFSTMYIHQIVFSPDGISRDELFRLQTYAHFKFYMRPRILWRIMLEIKTFKQLAVVMQRALQIMFPRVFV